MDKIAGPDFSCNIFLETTHKVDYIFHGRDAIIGNFIPDQWLFGK